MLKLEASRWKRKQLVVPALEHDYRHGFQHVMPKTDVSVKAVHGTMIVWLQNDAGYQRWGPTEVSLLSYQIFHRKSIVTLHRKVVLGITSVNPLILTNKYYTEFNFRSESNPC